MRVNCRGIGWIAFLTLSACAGGGGSSSAEATTPDSASLGIASLVPPDGADKIPLDMEVVMNFSTPMDFASINAATFQILQGSSPVTGVVLASELQARFTPVENLDPLVLYTARLSGNARRKSGEIIGADFQWQFTTEARPPQILETVPKANDPLVDPTVNITIKFFDKMQVDTVTAQNIYLTGPQGLVDTVFSFEPNARVAKLVPLMALAEEVFYTVTVSKDVKNLLGVPLKKDVQWSFRTRETIPPTIVSTFPLIDSEGVSLQSDITMHFSEPMDRQTLNQNTLMVQDSFGVQIPGVIVVAADDLSVTFTPRVEMLPEVVHTVTLTTGAQDQSLNGLAQDFVWSFKTIPFLDPLCIPENLSTVDNLGLQDFVMDGDGLGNVLTIWTEQGKLVQNQAFYSTFFRSFDLGEGLWNPVGPMFVPNGGTFNQNTEPQLRINSNGFGFLVWVRKERPTIDLTDFREVYTSRFDSHTQSWDAPDATMLSNLQLLAHSSNPQIGVDLNNNAIATWIQSGILWAIRYEASMGQWNFASRMALSNFQPSNPPVRAFLTMHDNGNAVVVWQQNLTSVEGGDGRESLFVRFYNVQSNTWSPSPVLVEQDSSGDASNPYVAMVNNSTAIVIWLQDIALANGGDGKKSIYAREFRQPGAGGGSQWVTSSVELLENDFTGAAARPSVALDRFGNIVATWAQRVSAANGGDDHDSIYVRHWDPVNNIWNSSGAILIETDTQNHASQPFVASSPTGHFVVVWQQNKNGISSIVRNVYDPLIMQWIGERVVSDAAIAGAFDAKAFSRAWGTALILWRQRNFGPALDFFVANFCD